MTPLVWQMALIGLALVIALSVRPWQQLQGEGHDLLHPLFGSLLFLACAWGLPTWWKVPLHLQWSGAGLVLLMLGWPLATLVFAVVGAGLALFSPMPLDEAATTTFWLGVVPATLAMGLGYLIRRYTPHHPLVYTLGRCFFGTVLSLFIASNLADWVGVQGHGIGSSDISRIARWLLAWGDGVVTGMLCAVFVAFKPQWLATWSDRLYLQPPNPKS